MLATLPSPFVFIDNQKNRISPLIRTPIFLNAFSASGQGPEKPIIEELDIEEEIFTFPYPEERGEISDIINPPLNGIVGKVLYTKGKANSYLTIRAGFSNVFSYLFFDSSLERPTRTAKPEFVSLTRQPEIAGSYRDLLIYSSYIASNANFSYTSNNSNNVYEMVDTLTSTLYSRESTPFYEYSFPMPMISRIVYYDAKENDKVYVQSLMQVKLQHYQNVPHKETHVQLVNTQVIDITSNNNVPDLNFRLNLKLDYEAPKLELPLVKSELPVLDLNIESDENKTVILPLYKFPHNVRDLVVPFTLPRLNTVVVPKYDEAKVKYEAMKNTVTLPLNLGFDDTLLRDGFIERLKKVSNVQVRGALRYKHGDSTERRHEIELRQYTKEREFIPKPNHQAIQLDFRLEEVQPQQITDISDFLPLYKFPHNVRDLVVPVTLPRLNTVVVPKYDEAKVKYEAMKNTVTLPLNLGFDDTLLRDGFIERLKKVSDVQVRDDLRYKYSDSTKRQHEITDISDLYGTNYQDSSEVRNSLLSNTEYKPREDLDSLVSINYDNGRALSLPRTSATSGNYNLPLVDFRLQVDTETVSISDSNYERIASKLDLEEAVERELTEEEQNIQSEVYEGDIAQGEVYEKNELKEEQETEINESGDSSISDLALTAGAVGLGFLAGAAGLFGALFKKDNDEEINRNKPEGDSYKPKEGKVKKNCSDTSQCFADVIDWLEGKLKNPTLSDNECESISQCYSEEIKNIQKAREYIKKRDGGYSCNGALHHLFHHIGFTTEQEKKYKLRGYVSDGEMQKGFKLATTIIVREELEGNYDIEAVWIDDEKGGQSEKITLKKGSAYAQLDISLKGQGYTPLWKIMSYIDTDTGEKRSGLYLETIAELHLEAKEFLGDKDEYGMNLMGLILLVNGQEPGKGTISMHDYDVKPKDKIDVVFKNDLAKYLKTKKSPEKVLEPALF